MRETLKYGDAVLIRKIFKNYKRGDVLYFQYPGLDSSIEKAFLFQRIIGLPGDTLEIIDKITFVNHFILKDESSFKQNYFIHLSDAKCDSVFQAHFKHLEGGKVADDLEYGFSLTDAQFDSVSKAPCIKSIKPKKENSENFDENCFPYSEHYRWNRDHYGKIYIPKKNDILKLDTINLDLYASIITIEKNNLDIRSDSILINSVLTSTYQVKQNYFFMMGDNRDNTVDSRIWGFLPESKIIGKVNSILRQAQP